MTRDRENIRPILQMSLPYKSVFTENFTVNAYFLEIGFGNHVHIFRPFHHRESY